MLSYVACFKSFITYSSESSSLQVAIGYEYTGSSLTESGVYLFLGST